MTDSQIPDLASLPWIPYLTEAGIFAEDWQRKIGVYAIFDEAQTLQYVGYSRDIEASLKQHLVRQSDRCYGLKVYLIERPSRSVLEAVRSAWLKDGELPLEESAWTDPIDAKLTMTEAEKVQYQMQDELGQIKLLKNLARRLEAKIQAQLQQRGVTLELRFNPKLKEQGLLDLK
ncbi:MAG: GIY-YIG nuclease family protein [Microcystaceae cyanobacterium]